MGCSDKLYYICSSETAVSETAISERGMKGINENPEYGFSWQDVRNRSKDKIRYSDKLY